MSSGMPVPRKSVGAPPGREPLSREALARRVGGALLALAAVAVGYRARGDLAPRPARPPPAPATASGGGRTGGPAAPGRPRAEVDADLRAWDARLARIEAALLPRGAPPGVPIDSALAQSRLFVRFGEARAAPDSPRPLGESLQRAGVELLALARGARAGADPATFGAAGLRWGTLVQGLRTVTRRFGLAQFGDDITQARELSEQLKDAEIAGGNLEFEAGDPLAARAVLFCLQSALLPDPPREEERGAEPLVEGAFAGARPPAAIREALAPLVPDVGRIFAAAPRAAAAAAISQLPYAAGAAYLDPANVGSDPLPAGFPGPDRGAEWYRRLREAAFADAGRPGLETRTLRLLFDLLERPEGSRSGEAIQALRGTARELRRARFDPARGYALAARTRRVFGETTVAWRRLSQGRRVDLARAWNALESLAPPRDAAAEDWRAFAGWAEWERRSVAEWRFRGGGAVDKRPRILVEPQAFKHPRGSRALRAFRAIDAGVGFRDWASAGLGPAAVPAGVRDRLAAVAAAYRSRGLPNGFEPALSTAPASAPVERPPTLFTAAAPRAAAGWLGAVYQRAVAAMLAPQAGGWGREFAAAAWAYARWRGWRTAVADAAVVEGIAGLAYDRCLGAKDPLQAIPLETLVFPRPTGEAALDATRDAGIARLQAVIEGMPTCGSGP